MTLAGSAHHGCWVQEPVAMPCIIYATVFKTLKRQRLRYISFWGTTNQDLLAGHKSLQSCSGPQDGGAHCCSCVQVPKVVAKSWWPHMRPWGNNKRAKQLYLKTPRLQLLHMLLRHLHSRSQGGNRGLTEGLIWLEWRLQYLTGAILPNQIFNLCLTSNLIIYLSETFSSFFFFVCVWGGGCFM